MATVLVCDATRVNEYSTILLPGGESALDRVFRYANDLPVDRRVVLKSPELAVSLPEGWNLREETDWDSAALLRAMQAESEEGDRVLVVAGDEPFLQRTITERILALQSRYKTEYTFADGYPEGVAPELLEAAILPVLRKLNEEHPEEAGRDFLFRIVQHDINAFDLETEIASVDLRLLRASLTCDSRRNHLLCRRLLESGVMEEEAILRKLQEDRSLLRTLPAYFNVQVTNRYAQKVSYEPFHELQEGEEPVEMELPRFEALLREIEAFAPESVVSIGYRGEPGLHSAVLEMIRAVEASRSLSLYLETSGVGWDETALEALEGLSLRRTTIIVLLDAASESVYRELRGEGFTEAIRFANRMRKAHPERCYVQATRLVEYQESLEEFYKAWKEDNPIIQKYNHFCGELPDRRVTDLSPLERFPCWHLQRDVTVLLDGTVPRCQEDIHRNHTLGNLFEEGLEAVWERGRGVFDAHTRGEYPDICGNCDEYYTYNA
ncbi:MAG: spiro-SPASM protein [Spirochaetaceae bacterium]